VVHIALRRPGAFARGVLTLLLLALPALPGPARANDLMTVLRLADENDPAWRAAIMEQRAAAEAVPQARARLLPQLNAALGYDYINQNIISSDNQVFATGRSRYPTFQYAVTLEQSLWNFAHWANLRRARTQVEGSLAALEAARQDMILRAVERYLQTVVALENLESVRAERRSIERLRDFTRARAAGGAARTTDALDAEARFLRLTARELEAQSNVRDATQALQEVTGRRFDRLRPLGPTLATRGPDSRDPEVWVQRALETNPRLMAARLGSVAAQQEIRRQQAEFLPRLGLVLEQGQRDARGSLFGGGSNIQESFLQLRLNVPIWQGGVVESRVREARALSGRADQLEIAEQRALERRARSALDGVLTSTARIQALAASVTAQERVVETLQITFRSGGVPGQLVVDAERDLFFNRFELTRARQEYVIETLRLKHVVGSLTAEDVAVFNALLAPSSVGLTPGPANGNGPQAANGARR
jgi:outer membrane protein